MAGWKTWVGTIGFGACEAAAFAFPQFAPILHMVALSVFAPLGIVGLGHKLDKVKTALEAAAAGAGAVAKAGRGLVALLFLIGAASGLSGCAALTKGLDVYNAHGPVISGSFFGLKLTIEPDTSRLAGGSAGFGRPVTPADPPAKPPESSALATP